MCTILSQQNNKAQSSFKTKQKIIKSKVYNNNNNNNKNFSFNQLICNVWEKGKI